MAFFKPQFGSPFAMPQQANPQQSAQAAMGPQQIVAQALMGPLHEASGFGNTSTPESGQRFKDQVRRGFTNDGMGMIDALQNAVGVLGGMGALKTGLGTLAEHFADLDQGMLGGLKDIRGYREYDQRVVDAMNSGQIKDLAGANRMQGEIDTARRTTDMSQSASRGHMGGSFGGGGGFSGGGGPKRGGSSRGQRGE